MEARPGPARPGFGVIEPGFDRCLSLRSAWPGLDYTRSPDGNGCVVYVPSRHPVSSRHIRTCAAVNMARRASSKQGARSSWTCSSLPIKRFLFSHVPSWMRTTAEQRGLASRTRKGPFHCSTDAELRYIAGGNDPGVMDVDVDMKRTLTLTLARVIRGMTDCLPD